MKKKTKTLLTALAVPLGVGAVSGFLTQGSMDTFEKLKQPPLTPPGWVFPVVWTGLFAMMGTASYLVAISPKTEKRNRALFLYGVQLAVNFLWPVFFFNAGWYFFAFVWLVLLHERIFGYLQERRIPDDPVSCMADFCRLSEFLYLSFKLSGSTV